jgi:hypothetical protein
MEKSAAKIPSYDEIMNQSEKKGTQLDTNLNEVDDWAKPGFLPPIELALQNAMMSARNLENQCIKLHSILEPIRGEQDKCPGNVVESTTESSLGKEINAITNILLHSTNIIDDILKSVEI